MACFHPLRAWHHGSAGISFSRSSGASRELSLPCGQCVGCRLDRSVQWACRIVHESQLHRDSCFLTLTYSDESFERKRSIGRQPFSLDYRDFQLFMKRLRKKLDIPLRYVMCGEYGSTFGRPHFHAILFGAGFSVDRYPWRKSGAGFQLYRSPLLESVWDLGSAEIGQLSFESAAYVARYCMSKVTGPKAEAHYAKLDLVTGEIFQQVPEFARMSLRPGIGRDWFLHYHPEVTVRDACIVNGMAVKPPRFYDNLLSLIDPDLSSKIKDARLESAKLFRDDSTPERLAVREIVTHARLAFKVRNLED